jgi:hypothetical protein
MIRVMAKAAAVDVMNLHVQTPHPAYTRADGNDVGRQAMLVTKKVLNGLEAKLNKLLQRKSEVINENKQKKLKINHLRRMRVQTEIVQSKYEVTLLDIKEKIELMSAESIEVVAERDKLVKEKENLEKINIEEQKIFTEQHESMSQFIKEQNAALEDALMKERKYDKNPTELLTEGNNLTDKTVSMNLPYSTTAIVPLTLEQEIDMVKQVGKLTNFVHNEQNSLSSIQTRINNYESMFDQLKHMTSCDNLDDVVVNYVAHEEEMFSLYHFLQSLNNEIEKIQNVKNDIIEDMKKFEQGQNELDDAKRKAIEELRSSYDLTIESINEVNERNAQSYKYLKDATKKVLNIYNKFQSSQSRPSTNNSSITYWDRNNQSRKEECSDKDILNSPKTDSDSVASDFHNALLPDTEKLHLHEAKVLDYLSEIEGQVVDIITGNDKN